MTFAWRDDDIDEILREAHTVAVVGLSSDRFRPSYGVARYLQHDGYRIIPVNPNEREVLGEQCYSGLTQVREPVDVVDVFRRSEFTPEIVDQAIEIGAKAVWFQLGIWNVEAAERARKAGLKVVMNHCMATELQRKRSLAGE
ncbi:MAG: CoA-binding protein [Chloroflexota bacterium]|nr:CoA-binding protein [Chloroflexota bacterium]